MPIQDPATSTANPDSSRQVLMMAPPKAAPVISQLRRLAVNLIDQYPVRLLIYGVIAFLLCQFVFIGIEHHGVFAFVRENGPLEQTQAVLALLTCLCFFFAASRLGEGSTVLVLCGCLIGYAAARECDDLFESVFFDDAYKYLAGIPLLSIALVTWYRNRHGFLNQASRMLQSPALTMFVISGIYVCSICQAFDRPALWTELEWNLSTELTKATVEEFAESFGYVLLAFSGIETVMMVRAASCAAVQSQAEPIAAKQAAA